MRMKPPFNAFAYGLATMSMSPPKLSHSSKKTIDREFHLLGALREIHSDPDTVAFLDRAQSHIGMTRVSSLRGPFQRSLMHYAAMGNCTEMLRFLLREGASQNDPDGNKRTPLSWAAEYGALNAAIILVQSGAKVNQTDDMFATPLTWVIQFGPGDQSAIAAYLKEHGAIEKGFKRRWIWAKLGLLGDRANGGFAKI